MGLVRKIAVTGASGFVGRHVLCELVGRGMNVVAVTRDKNKLADFAGQVEVVELDLAYDAPAVFEQLGRPDVLIHLAWDGLPNYRSLHHFETELPRQYAFLSRMIRNGLKRLVVSGTCLEYGMQSGPLSEDMDMHPANPYGYAKNALHNQLDYLRGQSGFHLAWARLFYVFGEGQNEASLLPQLKKAVAEGSPVFNMSGGEQLRDYLAISEVASSLVALAECQRHVGAVNICSGVPCSVRRVVEQWILENQWDIRLNLGFYPYPDYEPMAFWGRREKLDAVLKGFGHATSVTHSRRE